ncbi:MAG: CBS domain-containing protein, partial [Candidatus Thorarchaeota archaeon]|nr:CBS domain-containing protein [Candidatus Thorarchaeota archaeon]
MSTKRKPGLADENYVMCEGWMYDTEEVTVKEIMRSTTDVKEGTSVSKAVTLMAKQKVGALLVKKYENAMLGQTVGIVTEQDFVQKVLNKGLDSEKL